MECLARLRFASFRVRDASLELDALGSRSLAFGSAAARRVMPDASADDFDAVDGVRDGLENRA